MGLLILKSRLRGSRKLKEDILITSSRKRRNEKIIHSFLFIVAFSSIIILLAISIFLIKEGVPIFKEVSVKDFVFGHYWYPTSDPPDFGIFPLIMASVDVTALATIIAVPLGLLTAIYLAECASPSVRQVVKPLVELIAAFPSVVIGFFGMVVVAPFLQSTFNIPTGLNMFNAALMLSFMSIPTICSLSEDAIYAVPKEVKEASLALGATHWETIIRVTLPASISGISTAVILGMSRAIGETMVVLMVAGGAALIPSSIFDPVRPMPASIAAEMAEAPYGSNHYHALFAIGIVLFFMTFVFNFIADRISKRYRQVGSATL